MNKNKLRAICLKVATKSGLNYNAVLVHFFLESILCKISKSIYKKNFIFKGGFLLSNIIGISQRTTYDIDALVKSLKLTKEEIIKAFNLILQTESDDDIKYEILKISDIKKEDEYGGFRLTIVCKLENIREIVAIDIATGDSITPSHNLYEYQSIFSDTKYDIFAYNIETILAEKIQTLYTRGLFNTRIKDFYDIYILYKLKYDDINFSILLKSCKNTFLYRKTEFNLHKILEIIKEISEKEEFRKLWKSYQKKFPFTKEIKFNEVINSAEMMINELISWSNVS